MRYLIEGKTRVLLFGAMLLVLGAGCATLSAKPVAQASAFVSTAAATVPVVATTKTGLATTREQLCLSGSYSTPTKQEIEYNTMIAKNGPVAYLRRALDAYLDESCKACIWEDYRDKKADCIYLNDIILPDLDQLSAEKSGYLQSKFIVLSTDIAVGGGEDMTLIFKVNNVLHPNTTLTEEDIAKEKECLRNEMEAGSIEEREQMKSIGLEMREPNI